MKGANIVSFVIVKSPHTKFIIFIEFFNIFKEAGCEKAIWNKSQDTFSPFKCF